jgi:hypothetical protein
MSSGTVPDRPEARAPTQILMPNRIGAAWVFTRSGGVWIQQDKKLVGTDAVGSARQGTSVALSDDGNTAYRRIESGSDTAGKRLELLREVVPGLSRFAVLANLACSYPALEVGEVQQASRTLGLEVSSFDIRRAQDIALAFDALKGHADALYVIADPLAPAPTEFASTPWRWARDCRLCTLSPPGLVA